MHDPMQTVFDGAEAIAQALHSQGGCEMALYQILDPVLAGDQRLAQMVYALIDSMALFRAEAEREAKQVLTASIGR